MRAVRNFKRFGKNQGRQSSIVQRHVIYYWKVSTTTDDLRKGNTSLNIYRHILTVMLIVNTYLITP